MDFGKSLIISASAMRAQGQRMQLIAENLANANSLPISPEKEPYRRKIPSFASALDRASGQRTVKLGEVLRDKGEFEKRYDPAHPGADADGYVRVPNVNALIEMMDMREAQRSYEANLSTIETAKLMLKRTLELLKA